MMEDRLEGEDAPEKKPETFSPKVARPKLPKFSSHTLGHHYRHKTDPGQATEIKNLMEEIKKWKDGSLFEKSQIRPKVIKPQTIPKAHSSHTSPRSSPPLGSPNIGSRSSSLNRNRSKSLKLLTDKLKSGRSGGGSSGSTSPRLQVPKLGGERIVKAKSEDPIPSASPSFPENYVVTDDSKGTCSAPAVSSTEDLGEEKAVLVDTIPERDEKDDEESRYVGTPEKGRPTSEFQVQGNVGDGSKNSPGYFEDDNTPDTDADTPTTHVSTYTLHPIDRNSKFLKLRQTAPPQRRPAYSGLSLPKPKMSNLYKSQSDDSKDTLEGNSIKKPNRLELSGPTSSRKSGSRFARSALGEDGLIDANGYSWLRSPSTESPPPSIKEFDRVPSDGSGSPADACNILLGQNDLTGSIDVAATEYGAVGKIDVPEVIESKDADAEKLERRNGRSPKQKSKSDPSGDKTFDFDVAGVINSSQSSSFPLLGRKQTDSVSDVQEDLQESGDVYEVPEAETPSQPPDLDIVNNNENMNEGDTLRLSGLGRLGDKLFSISDEKSISTSSIPEEIFSPDGELEIYEDAMSGSVEIDDYSCQDPGETSKIPESEETEGASPLPTATFSCNSSINLIPDSPAADSPTGSLESPHNLLNVPSPKRPILRSVSSASVLQRERKFSGGSLKDKEARKHSLTTGEDVAASDGKPMDFIPIGDTGNALAVSMPSVWNTDRHASVSPERDPSYVKDKRYHIVEELYRNEREYVDALKMLKERYMDPLKTVSGIDERVVDNIFYMIPEILTHHQIYLEFLNQVWTCWKTDTSTVGDIILKTFSGQSVQDSYVSFVENYKTSGKVIENALQTKSSVQKFVEQCQKESGSKLSMKDLIVRPIQRIPRYELLIQRLLVNTPGAHPDYALLQEAEKAMHVFARKVDTANETQVEDGQQETLKKLELLLITDLAVPDRSYLRHDMVQIMSKKDQCCIWMFSDLIILSSIKRKSGPVTRKVSIILKSPTGQDFAENVKHKMWLRVGLDDIEIVKSQVTMKRTSTLDKEQVEEDLDILEMIQDLSNKLNCRHAGMDDVLKDMTSSLKKQLTEHNVRESLLDSTKMELLVTTPEGVQNLEVHFPSAEKRVTWESTFLDAKQKLSLLSDKRAPEFLQPLQITKTRAGMQFSCAAPIDGFNSSGYRDVWVCNSDGYVGHMCLLSLQPEPIVTLNTPVPGCNARILCIGAVPAHGCLRRKSSAKRYKSPSSPCDGPRISIEEVDSAITEEEPITPGDSGDIPDTISEEGYQSDSSSSEEEEEETDEDCISPEKLFVEEYETKEPEVASLGPSGPDPVTTTGTWTQDPMKSTMWLGTEDGCIHIFHCTDNIKTTKNKLKMQLGYPVYCIIYLDNKVFVSLSNGDLIVYRRDSVGTWDTENPYTRAIGSVTAPIMKMLAVAGKLWCGRQNNICVINPLTLSIEKTFQVHPDSNRCVQCIVNSGQGVWIASQQSSKVLLYHATTFEFLLEVSIAQAVNQKLQSADDIIRQHKAACLRITALLVCKDLLWIGTSAGVILRVPMPKITSTTTRGSLTVPGVTGLVYGHTGHVRFLTCVELSNGNMPPLVPSSKTDSANNNEREAAEAPAPHDISHRRSSVATMTATLATRMLVISGGDGYEDFRNNVANECAGKDDSTNHLLLWQV